METNVTSQFVDFVTQGGKFLMDIKEAKEVIRAGFAWAGWSDYVKEAMTIAYESMDKVEELKKSKEQLDTLAKYPYARIIMYLEKRGYSWTVTDVLNGYQQKQSGCYVSHTMNDCIKNLESEIKELLSN